MLKKILLVVVILFVVAQFVRPERTNPPVDPAQSIFAKQQVSSEAKAILERSCGDCHSNDTKWPWYTNITPINWWIAREHVEHGRGHWNYSTWDPARADMLLEEMCEEVESDKMPMPSYLRMHAEAKLSAADKRTFCEWTLAERNRMKAIGAPQAEQKTGEHSHAPGTPPHKH